MNEDENLSEEGLQDPYESELKKEKEAENKRIEEAKDDLTEGKIRRKRTEEGENRPLGARLFDAIDSNLQKAGQFIADAAEDKPGIADDIVRGGIQGLSFVGNLPVIKQIGQLEEAIVGGVGNLAERQDVIDPRAFTYGTRLGLIFAGDKGVRKVVKVGKEAVKTRKINQLVRGKDFLGQPLIRQNPITGGIQEQFTSEGLKDVLLQRINRTPQGVPKSGISPYPTTQLTSPYYDWSVFGYKSPARTLPTQVRKVLGTDLQDEVALSLYNQYKRANEYFTSTGSLKGFGEKFVNPATGKLYYIQRTRGKNPRFTLQSVDKKLETIRRRREKDVASMPVQELLKKFKTKDIEALNKVESAKFKEATDPIIRKIQLNSKEIHKYNQYPDIQESIAAQIAEDGRKLDAILEGYYYGEHGHAIRSKVWDHVKRIKRFANQKLMFKAGDGKNFHIVFEPNKANQTFKKLKDDFETIIERTIGKNQKRYPDVIVNYNPVLSGPGKKIRFEKLSTLKVGFKSRRGKTYPDMMYGDLIAEYDVDKLGIPTPTKMQKWLDENLVGEKIVGKKATVDADFKKTRKPASKIEDLTLKQSTKKKYVKKKVDE